MCKNKNKYHLNCEMTLSCGEIKIKFKLEAFWLFGFNPMRKYCKVN